MRAVTHAELGGIYLFGQKSPQQAEPHYREATAISPRAELYSLGLFHSLAGQGRWSDALAEMCRFLEHRASDEYKDLLLGDGFTDMTLSTREERELARKARDLVARWNEGQRRDD